MLQCESVTASWELEQLAAAEVARQQEEVIEKERRHRKRVRGPVAAAAPTEQAVGEKVAIESPPEATAEAVAGNTEGASNPQAENMAEVKVWPMS